MSQDFLSKNCNQGLVSPFYPRLVPYRHLFGVNNMAEAFVTSTEYTEWQRPLSGLHSIMMDKMVQAGENGGARHARPPPFTISTTKYKVVVCAPAEGADSPPPPFLLYPSLYVLCGYWYQQQKRGNTHRCHQCH